MADGICRQADSKIIRSSQDVFPFPGAAASRVKPQRQESENSLALRRAGSSRDRHRVAPLEFDGREDSVFQPYNRENQKFMEYVELYGVGTDIPVEDIVRAWKKAYGEERVRRWIEMFEEQEDRSLSEFDQEEVYRG